MVKLQEHDKKLDKLQKDFNEHRKKVNKLNEKSKYIMTNNQNIVIEPSFKVDNRKQVISNLNDVLNSIKYFINNFQNMGKGIDVYNIGMLKLSKKYIKSVRKYIYEKEIEE